jgi:hypothetical protein
LDDVAHGAGGLFDGGLGIGAMAVDDVHVIHAESFERAVDAFEQTFAVERVAFIRTVVQAPENLGRDEVAAAPPAQFLQRLAHHLF